MFAVANPRGGGGYRVGPATNAREAFAALQQHPDVALVLMDVMLPEMDGYRATQEIRHMGPFADLPIVALTAKAMKGDREKELAAGMSDFVAKPVDNDELVAVLHRWLGE